MSQPSDPRLDERREEIESIDRQILDLVRRRIGIVEEIGRIKKDARIPLRNFRVEERVKERLREHARSLGVDERLGDDLALFLIRKAVEVQSQTVDAAYAGDRMRVLVVGGLGGMGKWISRFLNIQGHQVWVHDTAPVDSMFPRAETLEAGVAEADLVIVAVPMSACPDVLRSIAKCKPKGVVAEMCSLKSQVTPVIRELRNDGIRAVSFHPMFGPDAKLLSGKQIVLCRDGHGDDEDLVRGLFADTSARLIDVPLEDHDRFMAVVLGMAHLLNLGFAGALSHFGVPFDELSRVASVTFLKQIVTTREVVTENPSLYYEIQKMNPSTKAVLDSLVRSFEAIRETIDGSDPEAFGALMRENRDYFGEVPAPRRADLWEVLG